MNPHADTPISVTDIPDSNVGTAHNKTDSTDSNTTGNNDSDSQIAVDGRQPNAHNTGTSITTLIAKLRNLPYFHTSMFFLWLAVAITLLTRKITTYQSFLSFLKASSAQVSDIETLNLLSGCEERLHIRGKVELYTNPLIASPILTGFFRPRIILPCHQGPELEKTAPATMQQQTAFTGTLKIRKKELSYIFTHELIHYRRHDMFYKWFLQLLLCVHWFNPFVYLLVREAGKACELACDESVIASLDDAGKKAYGNTLLASLQTHNAYKSPRPFVTLAESAKELKERLGAIMNSHKKTKSKTLLTVLATAAVCIAFGTLGAYAKSSKDNPAKIPTSAPEHTGGTDNPDNLDAPSEDNFVDNHSSIKDTASITDSAFYEQDSDIYYIYTEGTDSGDRPSVGFTEGTIGVVLVGKGSYVSLGPFDRTENAEDFLEEISQVCQDMADSKKLTPKDAQIILTLAEIIKDRFPDLTSSDNITSGYTFVQKGYPQDSGTIAYEGADILYYENGAPYLRDILANYTNRTITEIKYCILAYDADGQPLRLRWNLLDSSAEATYDNLVYRTDLSLHLPPGRTTENYPGGWSLSDEDAARISYAIYCLEEVVFADGTTWSNPDYEDWHAAYAGKEISKDDLEDYYPCEYAVEE